MEKKSYCDHAEQSSFSGLGELSSKANLNGVSKGLTRLTSLVTEDVRIYLSFNNLITLDGKQNQYNQHIYFSLVCSSRPTVKNVRFQDEISGFVYIVWI